MYDGPEARVIRRIKFFSSSYELLLRNYRPLMELIDAIDAADPLELLGSINSWKKHELLKEISFRLHDYVAAVKTLVDHSRALYNQLYRDAGLFPDYPQRVESTFVNDPEVGLVQGLRELAQHYALPNIFLVEVWGAHPTFHVVLNRDDLLKFDRWDAAVKRHLRNGPQEIPLRELCARYQAKVVAFYEWMYERLNCIHSDALAQANAEEMHLYQQWVPRFIADLEKRVQEYEHARRVDMTRVFNPLVFASERRELYELESNPRAWTEAVLSRLARRVTLPESLIRRIRELSQRATEGAG